MADQIEEIVEAQTPTKPEPVGHAQDVRNDVADAIKKLKGDGEPPPDTEQTDEHPEPAADRARGPDGKFLAKDKAEAAPAPIEKQAAPEKVEAAPKSPPVDNAAKPSAQQSNAASAAPVGWAADAKTAWASLPPAVQQAVIKRETEIANGGRQWSEEKRRYQTTLAPLVEETQRLGIAPEQGLNALLAAHRMLQQNPAAAIAQLAQQHGVDLANLASNPPASPPQFDPVVSQLGQKLSQLESQLSGFFQNQTMGVVEKFASENPHYAAVEEDIARLIPGIQKSNPGLAPSDVLAKAYEQAIWLNQDVRAQLIQEQTQTAQKQQQDAIQAKAQKASKAAVSVRGSSNGVAPMPKALPSGGDVYDDVRAAIHQLRQ